MVLKTYFNKISSKTTNSKKIKLITIMLLVWAQEETNTFNKCQINHYAVNLLSQQTQIHSVVITKILNRTKVAFLQTSAILMKAPIKLINKKETSTKNQKERSWKSKEQNIKITSKIPTKIK